MKIYAQTAFSTKLAVDYYGFGIEEGGFFIKITSFSSGKSYAQTAFSTKLAVDHYGFGIEEGGFFMIY